jgi:hypothetical protein
MDIRNDFTERPIELIQEMVLRLLLRHIFFFIKGHKHINVRFDNGLNLGAAQKPYRMRMKPSAEVPEMACSQQQIPDPSPGDIKNRGGLIAVDG